MRGSVSGAKVLRGRLGGCVRMKWAERRVKWWGRLKRWEASRRVKRVDEGLGCCCDEKVVVVGLRKADPVPVP